ncbi:hypothetical protein AXF14_04355 [Actinomyces radicidentis]|uniref:Uncharacterized protein n=1 Tax=Actinomyces radicidentis TaxID=111015 RepID=A0A0X8JDN3_ACTRD|nr:hypothetical protein AXF14_04355 [Actinomyces radicidentis]
MTAPRRRTQPTRAAPEATAPASPTTVGSRHRRVWRFPGIQVPTRTGTQVMSTGSMKVVQATRTSTVDTVRRRSQPKQVPHGAARTDTRTTPRTVRQKLSSRLIVRPLLWSMTAAVPAPVRTPTTPKASPPGRAASAWRAMSRATPP